MLTRFVSKLLVQARVIWEKEKTTKKMFPPDWPEGIFLMGRDGIGWDGMGEGSSHCGSCCPGLVVLAAIRKQDEQATESKPVNNTPP